MQKNVVYIFFTLTGINFKCIEKRAVRSQNALLISKLTMTLMDVSQMQSQLPRLSCQLSLS